MMRPARSKHGLDRKYKPWRRGKSSAKNPKTHDGKNDDVNANGGGNSRSRTNITSSSNNSSHATNSNASLKNMLRSQKRLLEKLQRGGGKGGEEEAIINATQQKIHRLEQDIRDYQAKEREKKNAVKYHQVKFIERQKVTRLEKSLKRQLQHLVLEQQQQQQQQPSHDSDYVKSSPSTTAAASVEQTQQQISHMQQQLQSIAMDQLYIAFFPTNMKYMALFTNGMNRVVDDERGQKRRKAVWNVIREGLLAEAAEQNKHQEKEGGEEHQQKAQIQSTKTDNGSSSSSSDSSSHDSSGDSDDDSSSVPSDDSDGEPENDQKKECKNADGSMKESTNKLSLKNAKKWVNLEEAKRALLSMSADTYPNDPSFSIRKSIVAVSTTSGSALPKNQQKSIVQPTEKDTKRLSTSTTNPNSNKGIKEGTKASDSRFQLSKDLDSLFHESTTGIDYQEKLLVKLKEDNGASCDDSANSSNDNEVEDGSLLDYDDDDDDSADPLQGSDRKEMEKTSATVPSSSSSSSASSTSFSSSSTDDSDDNNDRDENSDSDSDTKQTLVKGKNYKTTERDKKNNDDDGDDDFFASKKISTEDVFNAIQNEKKANHTNGSHRHNNDGDRMNFSKKPDKSKGFKTQNQSKREYRSFQHRVKRQKFG